MNSSTFLFAHVSHVVLPCQDCYTTWGCESLKQPLALVKGSARFQSHLFQQHRANSVSCSLNPLTTVHCLLDSHAYRLPLQYTMATCILNQGIVSSYLVYNQESAKTKHAKFGCIFSQILEISDTLNILENSTKKDQPYTDNCIPVQKMPAIFLVFFPK